MTTPRIAWIPIAETCETLQPVELVDFQADGLSTVRGLQLTYKDGQTWLRKGEFAQIDTHRLRIETD